MHYFLVLLFIPFRVSERIIKVCIHIVLLDFPISLIRVRNGRLSGAYALFQFHLSHLGLRSFIRFQIYFFVFFHVL